VVLHARVERRGWCRLGELELKTAYPFGFIEKSWRFPLERQVLVLPHPRTSSQALDLSGEALRTRPAAGDVSPEGARPYRTGDSTSRVHWKRTAQRRAPWIRTFEGEEAVGLRLKLDLLRWEPGRASNGNWSSSRARSSRPACKSGKCPWRSGEPKACGSSQGTPSAGVPWPSPRPRAKGLPGLGENWFQNSNPTVENGVPRRKGSVP